MLAINRFTAPVVYAWQSLPRGCTPVLLTALSILLAKRVSSDYRIRAAIVLGTALLCGLVKKIHERFSVNIEKVQAPVSQPAAFEKNQTSYLSLLPVEILPMVGSFIDYATYRTWDSRPLELALHTVREGYFGANPNIEAISRRALALDGVLFCPYLGETALEHWKRYQAVISPESKLFQGKPHRFSVKKLDVSSKPLLVQGPLLIVNEVRGMVAYHWPTGAVKWVQADRSLSVDNLDLMTGQRIASTKLFRGKKLEQLEILDPLCLFDHDLKQKIHLNQPCRQILNYSHPLLFFSNENGIWIKNGDQPETLFIIQEGYRLINFALTNFPYFVAVFLFQGRLLMGIYHIENLKLITATPMTPIFSIQQRSEFTPEGPKPKDALFYVDIAKQCSEVQIPLQHPEEEQKTPIKNVPIIGSAWSLDPVHINQLLNENGKLEIFSKQRPHSFFPLPKEVKGMVESTYNHFMLISRLDGNNQKYFVLDLAEQSLTAQPL